MEDLKIKLLYNHSKSDEIPAHYVLVQTSKTSEELFTKKPQNIYLTVSNR